MRQQQDVVDPPGRGVRRPRMTRAERALWSRLRQDAAIGDLRREVCIGPYRVAFASAIHRVAIEVERGRRPGVFPNPPRAMAIECRGWRVLQFRRHEILEAGHGVLAAIRAALVAQR